MNIISKKLHVLEKNVLPELPEEGTTKITWENGDIALDRAECELHRRAIQILEAHAEEMQEALSREKRCHPLVFSRPNNCGRSEPSLYG